MLREQLRTDYSEATLWSEEGRLQPSAAIIEMLEGAVEQYDFAVIILAKDDVVNIATGKTLKARDNCVFEAGLFMSAIGRKRCFLVNSVVQSDLPSDLGGIISVPFEEPSNLTDRLACARAMESVAGELKTIVQRDGPSPVSCASAALLRRRSVQEGAATLQRRRLGGRWCDRRVRHATLGGTRAG